MTKPNDCPRRRNVFKTLFQGALLGVANIIPGVSGGTFALLLGIFDRLIGAINAINLTTLRAVLQLFTGGFRAPCRSALYSEMRRIDAGFLLLLGGSAVASAASLSFVMEYLLTQQTDLTLSFFIGLILPSIAIPFGMMEKRKRYILMILPGFAFTAALSTLTPDGNTGMNHPLTALWAGALSVCAMILPGISGSFVLLVIGQYQNVITKITGFLSGLSAGTLDITSLLWLVAFGFGLITGLLLFSRLLAFVLTRYRSLTMAFLIGLILGSLPVLWPFKDLSDGAAIHNRHGEIKRDIQIATAPNRLPITNSEALPAALALLLGAGTAISVTRQGRTKSDTPPKDTAT